MRAVFEKQLADARKIERSFLQGTAELCSSPFGRACKAVWPLKTAEALAELADCSVRAAGYQLSGEHDPSGRSLLALMNAVTPKKRK